MRENEFMHYGVLGMKWGVRRTPEQLGHKIEKLRSRNEKLSKKTVQANHKASKWHTKATDSKYSRQLYKAQTEMMNFTIKKKDMERGRKSAKKIKKFNSRFAKWHRRATKYGASVYTNNVKIKELTDRIARLSTSEIVMKANDSKKAKKFISERI